MHAESQGKLAERILLARHFSERVKSCESMRRSYEMLLDEYEANKLKNSNYIKELRREIFKLTRLVKVLRATCKRAADPKACIVQTVEHKDSEGADNAKSAEKPRASTSVTEPKDATLTAAK